MSPDVSVARTDATTRTAATHPVHPAQPVAWPVAWRARWIWFEQPRVEGGPDVLAHRTPAPVRRYGVLRRVVDLDAVPDTVPARVTADSRYVLYVNGAEVARGPVRGDPRLLRYDTIDLAAHLRPGRNVLTALVCFYGRPTPWWTPAPVTLQLGAGAFLFEARLGTGPPDGSAAAGSPGTVVGSDGAWRARALDGWTTAGQEAMGPESEVIDARRLPVDLVATDAGDGADDSEGGEGADGWTPAVVLVASSIGAAGRTPPSNPYGPLLPRPIGLLGDEAVPARPMAVRLLGTDAGVSGVSTEDGSAAEGPVARVDRALTAAGDADEGTGDGTDRSTGEGTDGSTGEGTDGSTGEGTDGDADGGAVTLGGGTHLVTYDFGRVVAGTVTLDLDAPEGTVVDVSATEFADERGVPVRDQEGSGLRYVARGRADRCETFDPLGLRYAALAIHALGPVTVRRLGVRERLYPCPPGASFASDDPVLDHIWRVGRRTVSLCSLDAYVDCPTREQRAWTGDFVVHQAVDLATNPDRRLAVANLDLAAAARPDGMLPMAAACDLAARDSTYIPDWGLHWVRALHQAWHYTGDIDMVSRLLPVAVRLLRWFPPFRAADGPARGLLTDVTGWVIVDWSSVTVNGASSALNGLYARALLDLADLADAVDDAGTARWARGLHDGLAAAFEAFWDPTRELYVDSVTGDGRRAPTSQHAQAVAIEGRLAPRERWARLLDVMLDDDRLVHATWSRASGDARRAGPGESGVAGPYLVTGPPPPWWDVERQVVRAQPFFRYVVHDAVVAAGRADLLPGLCREWAALLVRSDTSWSETWYGGTVSHGWSSTPTRDLTTSVLGIRPEEPGFGVARVAPRPGPLRTVRGTAPTPAGTLSVEVDDDRAVVDSPVPVVLDLGDRGPDGTPRRLPAGRHEVARVPRGAIR